MGHTGPRTNASVLNYHIGRFNELFTLENGVWVYHTERVDAKMTADLGDMLGGLNSSYNTQYPGVPFPTDPDEQGPVPPTPIEPPNSIPPWNYPLYYDTPMWSESRRTGDNGYPPLDTRKVTVIPIMVPNNHFSVTLLKLSVAEYRGVACNKQVTLSRNPGDFVNYISFGQGNTAEASANVFTDFQPGDTIYFNIRFWSSDLNASGTDNSSEGVTIGGAWPR